MLDLSFFLSIVVSHSRVGTLFNRQLRLSRIADFPAPFAPMNTFNFVLLVVRYEVDIAVALIVLKEKPD